MDKFNQSEYVKKYIKDNYTICNVKMRQREADILAKYSKNLNVSKNKLLQKCLVYCYENMIDVADIPLSIEKK